MATSPSHRLEVADSGNHVDQADAKRLKGGPLDAPARDAHRSGCRERGEACSSSRPREGGDVRIFTMRIDGSGTKRMCREDVADLRSSLLNRL